MRSAAPGASATDHRAHDIVDVSPRLDRSRAIAVQPQTEPQLDRLRFAFPEGELESQILLGHVTDRSVRVWARHEQGTIDIRVTVDGEPVAETTLDTDPQRDHVGAADVVVDPPRPGARFSVEAIGLRRSGRFAPTDGTPAEFRFLFGSCHQPFDERIVDGRLERHPGAGIYARLMDLLTERDAGFLLLLGDQIYSDAFSKVSVRERLADTNVTDEQLVEAYRHLHRGYFAERGFRSMLEAFPARMTWDDHDIYDGAGSLKDPTPFDDRLRAAASVAYVEYQHLRNAGATLDALPPHDHHWWHGDVGFFAFDLRGCRSYKDGVIVGEEQWRRFDAFLAEADARAVPTLFIAASVPVVHGSPLLMDMFEWVPIGVGKDIRDRWNIPRQRHEREALLERLFSWQSARGGRRVAILSGDVHVGAAFSVRPRRGRNAPQVEQWTSSALSTPTGWSHRVANALVTGLVRLGEPELRVHPRGLVPINNAALVDVAPRQGGGHDVTLRIHAYDPKKDRLDEALVRRLR